MLSTASNPLVISRPLLPASIMDYRSAFTDPQATSSATASGYSTQRSRLLSASLSSNPPRMSGYHISSPMTAASPASAAMANLSPITARSLLLSAAAAAAAPPLDRTIRLHRRDQVPTAGDHSAVRLSLRTGGLVNLAPAPCAPSAVPQRRRRKLPSASVSPQVRERKRFLVFIKVLLKCLQRGDNGLHQQAKLIISDCIRRNRRQDPQYTPLPEAVERSLRPVVGETQWKRATACLELYLKKKQGQVQHRVAPSPADPLNVFPELRQDRASAV